MAEHRAEQAPRRGRRGARRASRPVGRRLALGVALLATAGLALTASPSTFAFWNDTSAVTTGSITSGSMDLQLAAGGGATGAVGMNTPLAAGGIAFSNLAPGETKAFNLNVVNVGNPSFTWTATVTQGTTWTFVNPAITVQLYSGAASAPDTTYPITESCGGTAIGTQQSVDGTSKALVSGTQTVAGGSNQTACVVVGVAPAAGNGNQSKSGTLSFAFTANQVVP